MTDTSRAADEARLKIRELMTGRGKSVCLSHAHAMALLLEYDNMTRKVADMSNLTNQELCGETNPLVQAHCRLPKGHNGKHWGHGPVWVWDDTGAETVPPSVDPPKASE